MLTTHEASAHLLIIDTIDLQRRCAISDHTGLMRMWRALESFAPRCNCRTVLRWSAWRDGVRWANCPGCGKRHRECQIWFGVS